MRQTELAAASSAVRQDPSGDWLAGGMTMET